MFGDIDGESDSNHEYENSYEGRSSLFVEGPMNYVSPAALWSNEQMLQPTHADKGEPEEK